MGQARMVYRFILLCAMVGIANVAISGEVDWDTWDNSVIRLLVVGTRGLDLSIESGTAFAINDDGDYITNHHVIQRALRDGEVVGVESLEPERIHEVDIVWQSEQHDLAMVHVETWKKPALTLSNGDLLKKGQDVYTIGFPGAADRDNPAEFNVSTLKKGVVSAFKNFPLMSGGRNIKMIEHDAPVNSGNSGGPLADACGRVVGINEQKALGEVVEQGDQGVAVNSAEGILFSINTVELMALLEKHHVKYQRDDHLCTNASSPSVDNGNIMLVIGGAVLLIGVGFVMLYRRIQHANNNQPNTRILSRMIRERMMQGGGEGNVVGQAHPVPQTSVLYRLVPERRDLGLPVLLLPSPGNYRLGRKPANNIQLVVPNQYVSGEHLLITVNPDHSVVVEDLGSTNKTHLAGVEMPRGRLQTFQPGQTLRLGHDEVIYMLQRG